MSEAVFLPLKSSLSVLTRTRDYMRISRKTGAQLDSLKAHWAQEILGSLKIELNVIGRAASPRAHHVVENSSQMRIPLECYTRSDSPSAG